MAVTIVAGAQWGDEGKGRVVDLLAQDADLVIRCQGGPNAGHTVVNDRGRFVLHSVPSGVFSERARCVIGAGTVINPGTCASRESDRSATTNPPAGAGSDNSTEPVARLPPVTRGGATVTAISDIRLPG